MTLLRRLAAVAAAGLVLAAPAALAQGNQGADTLNQSAGRSAGGGGVKAQVGAHTTDGTTEGRSGPQSAGGGGPPPPPDASLCDDFKSQPGYDDCLSKVTRR